MNNFCKTCHNLLTFDSDGDRTVKKCRMCNKTFETTAVDSLRYQKNKKGDISTREFELSNAEKDPVNKKIVCLCKTCGHGFARMIRTSDMQTFVKCIQCAKIDPYQDSLFD